MLSSGACLAGIPVRFPFPNTVTTAGWLSGSSRPNASSNTFSAHRESPGTDYPLEDRDFRKDVMAKTADSPAKGSLSQASDATKALTKLATLRCVLSVANLFSIANLNTFSRTPRETRASSPVWKNPGLKRNKRAARHASVVLPGTLEKQICILGGALGAPGTSSSPVSVLGGRIPAK